MPKTFSSEWRDYRNHIDVIKKAQVTLNLFPERTSAKENLKEARRRLFTDYEGFLNLNNSINETVLRTTILKWFSSNCRILNNRDVELWVNKQNLKNTTVKRVADNIVGSSMCDLCFANGKKNICPQVKGDETGCATKLVREIVTTSQGYIEIPNNEKNFEVFLNSSTQYLEKNVHGQETNESSPIEDIMFEGLKKVAGKHGMRLQREYPVYDEGRLEIRYSLDIVFLDSNTGQLMLDVETDGLTFHSGYQNMANDRARDRWLLVRGTPTMRFTSREIFNSLEDCVTQVDSALYALYGRGSKRKR